MTQHQLAKRIGVSRQALSLWEIGKREPSLDIIRKFCIVFDISADELLEIETEKQRQEIKINNSFNNFKNNGTINISNKN